MTSDEIKKRHALLVTADRYEDLIRRVKSGDVILTVRTRDVGSVVEEFRQGSDVAVAFLRDLGERAAEMRAAALADEVPHVCRRDSQRTAGR